MAVMETLSFDEIKELAHPEIGDELLVVLYNLQFAGLTDDDMVKALADPEAARLRCERAGPLWLRAIGPVGDARLETLSKYSEVEAWHTNVAFRPLGLDVVRKKKLTRHDTYGWKAQLESDHANLSRSVGEVEIACRMRRAGYKAYWMDLFGNAPPIWRAWTRGVYDLPVWLQMLCGPLGRPGWPDVVAYKDDSREVRFVEYKGPNDTINENQTAWFSTALERGVIDRESYVVAAWQPNRAPKLMLAEQKSWRA